MKLCLLQGIGKTGDHHGKFNKPDSDMSHFLLYAEFRFKYGLYMMKGGRGLWELRDLMRRRVGKDNKDQE